MGGIFAKLRRSPSLPTKQDYDDYTHNLEEIEQFLQGFVGGNPDQKEDTKKVNELGGKDYIQALKIQRSQLSNMRKHVNKALKTAPDREEPKRLAGMLDKLEKLCDEALERMSVLETTATVAGSEPTVSPGDGPEDQCQGRSSTNTHSDQAAEETVRLTSATSLTPSVDVANSQVSSSIVEVNEPRQQDIAAGADLGLSSALPAAEAKKTDEPPVDEDTDIDDDDSPSGSQTIDDWSRDIQDRLPERVRQSNQTTVWKVTRNASDFLEAEFSKYEKAKPRELQREIGVEFEGEEGIDRGSLKKEYFHLAFTKVTGGGMLKDCTMFEGAPGHLLPNVMTEHLISGFKHLGMMIAHAARNGCRGLVGLSPAIQHYLIHGTSIAFVEEMNPPPPMSIDDIADERLKNVIVKLHQREELTALDNYTLNDWLDRCDCRVVRSPHNNDLITQTLFVHYIFKTRIRQIEALKCGLDTMDLRQFLHKNPTPENIRHVFPSPNDVEATPDEFFSVVTTRGDNYDEVTFEHLTQFVAELVVGIHDENEVKRLPDLIQFLSGSPYLPDRVILVFNTSLAYPMAHACFNEIELPTRYRDYQAFRDAMLFSLKHGGVFTDK